MTDPETVLLARLCEELGGLDFDNLAGRISFQKRIYVLQAGGIDLGYRFTWDLHGPYSRSLAVAGERLAKEANEAVELGRTLKLRQQVDASLRKCSELMTPPPPAVDRAAWTELLASLHFLRTNESLCDKDATLSRLVELKPHLATMGAVLDAAWQRLEELNADAPV